MSSIDLSAHTVYQSNTKVHLFLWRSKTKKLFSSPMASTSISVSTVQPIKLEQILYAYCLLTLIHCPVESHSQTQSSVSVSMSMAKLGLALRFFSPVFPSSLIFLWKTTTHFCQKKLGYVVQEAAEFALLMFILCAREKGIVYSFSDYADVTLKPKWPSLRRTTRINRTKSKPPSI